MIDCQGIINIR